MSLKIVNIAGGLGNQMFQYAFAVMLQKRYPNDRIMVDTQHYNTLVFKHFGSVNLHNGYEIDQLYANATLPVAKASDLRHVTRRIPNYVLSRLARKFLPKLKTEYVASFSDNFARRDDVFTDGDRYYEGYWQSSKYYTDIIDDLRHIYTPPSPNAYNTSMISRITGCNSVGIHVRRGDYKNAPEFNGICTHDYYKKAIASVVSDGDKHTFFVFSNDIAWCRDNMPKMVGDHDIVFVDGNRGADSCWDMFLMTFCKELILANSTFSWWGAFLNPYAKNVYAPDPWLHRDCVQEIIPPNWRKIQ